MAVSPPQGARSSSLLTGLITDGAVLGFGVWTLAANAVVIAGGTITALTLVALALFTALLGGVVLAIRRGAARSYLADLSDDPLPAERVWSVRAVAAPLAFAVLALLGWLASRNPWVAWVGIALASVAACRFARVEPFAAAGQQDAGAGRERLERIALHLLALACALFTLLAHRPRSDDTLYLHLAVAAVDYPHQALLSVQTLHGPASATLQEQAVFPPYRVHSFELLGGLLSHLTGLQAVQVIHLGLATLLGWLTPFAIARLLRLLVPRYWLPALCVAVSFYFIEGSASRGYANHALVRMFNGKSALLTLMAPLICAYGLRFAARRTPVRLALLALAQVAAVGLSSTALWLAPVLGMVSVAAGTRGVRGLLRRVPLALLASAYVLGLGLWVMSQLTGASVEPAELASASDAAESVVAGAGMAPRFAELAEAVSIALGPSRTAIALCAVMLLSLPFAPSAVALRLFAGLVLVVSLGFGNPLLADAVARRVTGVLTYYRFFWLLPVPIMLATTYVSLASWLRTRLAAGVATAVATAALLGFYAIAVDRLVIGEANRAKLVFPPALKLWAHARLVAEEVCRQAPIGKHVLASQAVLQQLPIIHRCGHPLIAEARWLTAPEQDELNRAELVRYVGDVGDIPAQKLGWFLDALSRYHVDAVVLSKEAQPNARTKSLIRLADFEKVATADWEQIFVRTRPETQRKYELVADAVCGAVRSGPNALVLAPFGVSKVLGERACARALAAPARLRSVPVQELDAVLRLERHTYMEGDSEPADDDWIFAQLSQRGTEVAVLTTAALGNKRFKAVLRQLGFRSVKSIHGHTIVRRPLRG